VGPHRSAVAAVRDEFGRTCCGNNPFVPGALTPWSILQTSVNRDFTPKLNALKKYGILEISRDLKIKKSPVRVRKTHSQYSTGDQTYNDATANFNACQGRP